MKTEIVYSAQKRNFLPGVRYNNPRYFTGPRQDVASVIVIGGWDEIADAYRFSNPAMPVVMLEKPEDLADYLDRRMRAAAPKAAKPTTEEDEDMRFKTGTPEHKAYWAARRSGMTTRQAIAAAEAHSAPVAGETAAEATEAAETVDAAPAPPVSPDIPDDWRDMVYPRLRALAASVSDTPVKSRDDCERAIEAELARREGVI